MNFSNAKRTSARNVKPILENYDDISGQLVNYHKLMDHF